MNYILFDGPVREHLLPFTFTRPVAEVRIGIMTIKEKWEAYLGTSISYQTEAYLQAKFPMVLQSDNIFLNGSILPSANLLQNVNKLKER